MIYVGIDVAKDKHDCFAMNSDGEILIEKLTITNNLDGFETLYNSLMNLKIKKWLKVSIIWLQWDMLQRN